MSDNPDYELHELVLIIDEARKNSAKSDKQMVQYLRLQALFSYFQYSVASVRIQEDQIEKMRSAEFGKSLAHHKYSDCLLKIYSSAITSYSNIRTCLRFCKALLDNIDQSDELKVFRQKWISWAKDVIDKRDRIVAHPEEENRIVWKPKEWGDDGHITFREINPGAPLTSRKIRLDPRKDLEKLRSYLVELVSFECIIYE